MSIAFCTKLTDKGFSYLSNAPGLRKLVHLDASGCENVCFLYLKFSLKKILILNDLKVSPLGYQSIVQHCKVIERVVINDFPTLTDRHLKVMFFLKEIKYFSFLISCFKVVANCNKLTSVTILDSPFLSDDTFKYLSAARGLKTLKVSTNHSLTDSGFKAIARHCFDLQHIYITDCPRVTDSSLKSFSHLRNLSVLNVADCIRYLNFQLLYFWNYTIFFSI